VFGVPEYGLINFPYLPLTLAPFFDAGEAWTGTDTPKFRLATQDLNLGTSTTVQRGIVASAGISARFNVLGYAILEIYGAHPFQRPNKSWVYGVQLAPGW
jgi:hypothetical protein